MEGHFVLTGSRPGSRGEVAGGPPETKGPLTRRSTALVAALSLTSAFVAVVVQRLLFPLLSIDNDDAIYRYQAQALAHGHLFPPAPTPPASFTPWLAAIVDHHYVMKYTPLMPAVLALSLRLTGSFTPALAVLAATTVAMTYVLAVEVVDRRPVAIVAAGLMAASPVVIVQSGTLLSYLLSIILLEVFAWSTARAVRTKQFKLFALAGLAIGLSVGLRSFDAVVFGLPIVLWAASRLGRDWRVLLRGAGWLLAGAALPVAGLLAFDVMATGSALTLPFGFLESKDTLGFGIRKLYPTDVGHDFQIAEGLGAVGTHLWLMGAWAFGGVVTAPLTFWAVARGRLRGPGVALVASGTLLTVGYIGFWGTWNAADVWGGAHYVGPFYLLPVLIPVTVGGAVGLVHLAGWSPRLAVVAIVACVALSGYALWGAVQDNAAFADQNQAVKAMLHRQGAHSLFFVAVEPQFLMRPSSLLANGASLGGGPIYAVAGGNDDFTVLADHADHQPVAVHFGGAFESTPDAPWIVWTQRLVRRQAATFEFRILLGQPRSGNLRRLVVTWAGQRRIYDIWPTDGGEADLLVTADRADLTDRTPVSVQEAPPGGAIGVELDVFRRSGKKTLLDRVDVERYAALARGDEIDALVPDAVTGQVDRGLDPPLRVLPASP